MQKLDCFLKIRNGPLNETLIADICVTIRFMIIAHICAISHSFDFESEDMNMKNQNNEKKQLEMWVRGRKVTLSFSEEYNTNLSQLVRNALLDSFIRQNGLYEECESA